MRERNGIRVGQRVRDLDGASLGKVTALFDWGFAVRKGLPILIRSDYVVRYDEVRGVRDGELVVARSPRDLFALAAGEVPPSWRVPAPPGFPTAATPEEARDLEQSLAHGAVATSDAPPPADAEREVPPLTREEEREYVRTRGASLPVPPPR